ncbi:hypothetical protein [Nocardia sp. NPDC051570]|uniref:hypothetical protein n=1 Tax=Nocardia sp. NPDC051570 TaxID=3364324 RepID=UPI00379A387F
MIPTEYVTRRSTRIITNGHKDFRADSITEASEFPYPFPNRDNPMLEYLIQKARELEEEDGEPPYIWLAVHAWYEGACKPWRPHRTPPPNSRCFTRPRFLMRRRSIHQESAFAVDET